jgi:hypothetical protein
VIVTHGDEAVLVRALARRAWSAARSARPSATTRAGARLTCSTIERLRFLTCSGIFRGVLSGAPPRAFRDNI